MPTLPISQRPLSPIQVPDVSESLRAELRAADVTTEIARSVAGGFQDLTDEIIGDLQQDQQAQARIQFYEKFSDLQTRTNLAKTTEELDALTTEANGLLAEQLKPLYPVVQRHLGQEIAPQVSQFGSQIAGRRERIRQEIQERQIDTRVLPSLSELETRIDEANALSQLPTESSVRARLDEVLKASGLDVAEQEEQRHRFLGPMTSLLERTSRRATEIRRTTANANFTTAVATAMRMPFESSSEAMALMAEAGAQLAAVEGAPVARAKVTSAIDQVAQALVASELRKNPDSVDAFLSPGGASDEQIARHPVFGKLSQAQLLNTKQQASSLSQFYAAERERVQMAAEIQGVESWIETGDLSPELRVRAQNLAETLKREPTHDEVFDSYAGQVRPQTIRAWKKAWARQEAKDADFHASLNQWVDFQAHEGTFPDPTSEPAQRALEFFNADLFSTGGKVPALEGPALPLGASTPLSGLAAAARTRFESVPLSRSQLRTLSATVSGSTDPGSVARSALLLSEFMASQSYGHVGKLSGYRVDPEVAARARVVARQGVLGGDPLKAAQQTIDRSTEQGRADVIDAQLAKLVGPGDRELHQFLSKPPEVQGFLRRGVQLLTREAREFGTPDSIVDFGDVRHPARGKEGLKSWILADLWQIARKRVDQANHAYDFDIEDTPVSGKMLEDVKAHARRLVAAGESDAEQIFKDSYEHAVQSGWGITFLSDPNGAPRWAFQAPEGTGSAQGLSMLLGRRSILIRRDAADAVKQVAGLDVDPSDVLVTPLVPGLPTVDPVSGEALFMVQVLDRSRPQAEFVPIRDPQTGDVLQYRVPRPAVDLSRPPRDPKEPSEGFQVRGLLRQEFQGEPITDPAVFGASPRDRRVIGDWERSHPFGAELIRQSFRPELRSAEELEGLPKRGAEMTRKDFEQAVEAVLPGTKVTDDQFEALSRMSLARPRRPRRSGPFGVVER